jgi:hypothetical protein
MSTKGHKRRYLLVLADFVKKGNPTIRADAPSNCCNTTTNKISNSTFQIQLYCQDLITKIHSNPKIPPPNFRAHQSLEEKIPYYSEFRFITILDIQPQTAVKKDGHF